MDLNGHTLTLPERTTYIAKVIDARPQQASIGWVQRGLANARTTAALRNGVEADLTTFLQQLPQRPTDRLLLLRIRQLAISEHTGAFSEKAFAEVALEYLLRLDDGYHLVLSTAETIESSGVEVTAHHANNITQAFQQSLNQLAIVQWDAVAASPALTLEQIQRPQELEVGEAETYPVLTATAPKAGIYPDFLAFRNNMPDTTTVYVVERKPRTGANWKGTTEILPYTVNIKTGQRTALRNVWGFSDGQHLYVLHNSRFFPLEREGAGFGFTGFSPADAGAVNTAALAGGLIGAGIAAAATSGKPMHFKVNMRTGRIMNDFPTPSAAGRVPSDTTQLIIYRRAGGDKTPVTVSINDQPVGSLSGAAYLVVPWSTKQHEAHVCVSGGADYCLTVLPTNAAPVYLECSRQPTDPTLPPLTTVTNKVGEFNVKGIRLRQEQDTKKQAK
ncbi:hypothetical protein F1C16_02260 [Hymenobacter sp. NBH84]|uniref:hypothetical protein n=1 Tax=Hymenobacter sp. NBH84 TaxID=2596915 RepID=UPI0016260ED9|nr:hypothetical protein [Hymenobacter sp. NBH84]QNE38463.1 hypothetical protein F1C16_02260 [Hymenobacter sp. NBH84]